MKPVVPCEPSSVLQALRLLVQWVCWKYEWRDGKWTKVPYNARTGQKASSTDPATWSSFNQAVAAFQKNEYNGIGLVLIADGGYTAIDIDHCIDEHGNISAAALAIIRRFNSYTEISPSGRGIRIIILGTKPLWSGCKSSRVAGLKCVEVYSSVRYVTITGKHVAGTPATIESRQEELNAWCAMVWAQKSVPRSVSVGKGFDGDDVALLERAFRARNGAKFRRLLEGDTSMHKGDDSNADLALCMILAFWTGRDAERMDRLFRQSKLYRDKWERPDYRARTIQRAIEWCSQAYEEPKRRHGKRAPVGSTAPILDGPFGIRLIPISIHQTPSRCTVKFAVHVDDCDTGVEVSATDTGVGISRGLSDLLDIVASHRSEPVIDKCQRNEIRSWWRKVMARPHLLKLAEHQQAQAECSNPTEGDQAGPTMLDIALPLTKDMLGLSFVQGNSIWSERFGRFLKRPDFVNHTNKFLLSAIEGAVDFAHPTPLDPTKPIRHLIAILGVCWSEHLSDLPKEVHAVLGPDSKAAAAFRERILRLWSAPETWIKCQPESGEPVHVERMSLASRVRELEFQHRQEPAKWRRVLKGLNAFYRLERGKDGQLFIWLGMRWDVCDGKIKGVEISAIQAQTDLTTLMNRYGLSCNEGITDRLRDEEGQSRVCILSRELCAQLLNCEDAQIEAEERGVTNPQPDSVTALSGAERVDHETGEVLE